jgi:hypothetical protein
MTLNKTYGREEILNSSKVFYINLVPGHHPKIPIFNLNPSDFIGSNEDSMPLPCS